MRNTPDFEIPEDELEFKMSRSSGPGGQNVNKVSTRVTLQFDLEGSPSLTLSQKKQLRNRLANRISKDGVLQISSQEHRTQSRNRRAVVERFTELIAQGLRRPKKRLKTRVPASAKERRRQEKIRRSRIKHLRRKPGIE